MGNRILLLIDEHDFEIELNDSDTANAIWLAAPFDSTTNAWGDEIYFEVPVKNALENGRKVLEAGEIAFWPEGSALCVFFGPTPVSTGKAPEAISEVSPVGRLVGDPRRFEVVGDRRKVMVRRK
ncbi:MAG: hypothetical protein ISF22_02015 [Methanomassiliicoccus sp.]|nr:hypothetical protein [Methanomassiliicoccus sp.]